MPGTSFLDYAAHLQDSLTQAIAAVSGTALDLHIDQRSFLRGFIAGSLQFQNGSQLIFREFIDVSRDRPRLMYAYHLQDAPAI